VVGICTGIMLLSTLTLLFRIGWLPGASRDPPQLLYSPDLNPTNIILFPKLKKKLAGPTPGPRAFKKHWDGVARTVHGKEYAAAIMN